MVGKEMGNKTSISQPTSLPMVSGTTSITSQGLEHIQQHVLQKHHSSAHQ